MAHHIFKLAFIAVATLGCSGASFTGGGSGDGGGGATPESTTTTPTSTSTCTTDTVGVTLSTAQQDCIVTKGKTWDFKTGKCVEMPKATFTCDWATVVSQLDGKGLLTDKVKTSSQDGSKLITCSQSKDGNRIGLQFVLAKDGASSLPCSGANPATMAITTGCYTYYPEGNATPMPPAPSAEYDAYIFNCFNQI